MGIIKGAIFIVVIIFEILRGIICFFIEHPILILCVLLIVLGFILYNAILKFIDNLQKNYAVKFKELATEKISVVNVLDVHNYITKCREDYKLTSYYDKSGEKLFEFERELRNIFDKEKNMRLDQYLYALIVKIGVVEQKDIIEISKNENYIYKIYPYSMEEIHRGLQRICSKDIEMVKLKDEEILYINRTSFGKKIKSTLIEM